MNHENCKCSKCESSLHYQIPTHFGLQIIGLKVYWCHKCDAKNYIWPWTLNADDPLSDHNEM